MTYSRSRQLLGSMAEVADLLGRLDLASLPAVYSIAVKPHRGEPGVIDGAAMLGFGGTERDRIDAIRTWADAIGGVVLLGDEIDPGTDYASRRLSAVVPLPSGGLFEVWVTLIDLHPADDWTPADSELIPA
jgi:hypothetical protein